MPCPRTAAPTRRIGLQLGWLSLTGGGPFYSPPMDSSYTYTQVIILLTDGLNTQDRWYGDGSSLGTPDDAKIDAREQLASPSRLHATPHKSSRGQQRPRLFACAANGPLLRTAE